MHSNYILKCIFQWNYKQYISISFKNIIFNDILNYINKRPLFLAIKKNDIEIIKLLLNNKKLDVNIKNIKTIFFLMKFVICIIE